MAVQELTESAVGPDPRRRLVVLTALSAALVLPALVLAAFTAFFFDSPNAGRLAWVMAVPFLTLPLTIVAAVPVSWRLQSKGRARSAFRVAALPILQLFLAMGVFLVIAPFAGNG